MATRRTGKSERKDICSVFCGLCVCLVCPLDNKLSEISHDFKDPSLITSVPVSMPSQYLHINF